jgi:fatty-acyl-CoA synthase
MIMDDQPLSKLHAGGTVGGALLAAISRFAERRALVDEVVDWTYRDFGQKLGRYVAVFKAQGLRRGHALGVLSGNRAEAFAAGVAALIMGMRYTPLHPLAQADDHRHVVDDAELDALVVEPGEYRARAELLCAARPGMRLFSLGPMEGAIDLRAVGSAAADLPADEAESGDIAYLAYTGGTTGRPKGVMLSHRCWVAMMVHQGHDWDWPAEVRYLAASPITHTAGAMLYTVLLKGGEGHLLTRFNPERFCEVVAARRITAALLVPTMIYVLLDAPALRRHDLSSLDLIVYGGAPMSPGRLVEAIGLFGPVFLQLYAQTEAPQSIATLRRADHDPSRPDRLASCGLPGPLVTVKLLDADLNETPVGAPGEICVRGPVVMDGYWKQPEATQQALRGGWLHTGDVAVRDADGFLTIVDRLKDMIVTGGFNVYPREVEDALLSHPSVASAAVIGVPDAKWGEAVHAFVVAGPDMTPDADALLEHVRASRGAVWTPKRIHFVDEIPLTGLGKVDRRALRAPFWAGRGRQVG